MFPRVIEQQFSSFCSNAEGFRDTVCSQANRLLSQAQSISVAVTDRLAGATSGEIASVIYHPLTVGVLGGTTAICLQNAVRACWNRQYRNSLAWGALGVTSFAAAMHVTHIADHPSVHARRAAEEIFG